MLFGHLNVTLLPFVSQSLVSGFIVSGVILSPIDVIFLWLEYERMITKSDDPNVTAIHVSLNSHLFCHVQALLVSNLVEAAWLGRRT